MKQKDILDNQMHICNYSECLPKRVLKDIEQHAERNNLSILQAVDEWIKHEIGKE